MKLVMVMMTILLVQAHASTLAQQVSLNEKKTSLQKVIDKIRTQSGYDFLVLDYQLVSQASPVTIQVNKVNLKDVLDKILHPRGLDYTLLDQSIVIKERAVLSEKTSTFKKSIEQQPIRGRVVDTLGNPLSGVTIRVIDGKGKRTRQQTSSNNDGYFVFNTIHDGTSLEISYLGYITQQIKADPDIGTIRLLSSNSSLDEVQVIAYGTTTKRLNTGSVGSVKAETIEKQPVGNVLNALTARVPGLDITQQTGVPGGAVTVRIRGQNSLTATANDPLFLIDGVPFLNNATTTTGSQTTFSPAGGHSSPFNALNPADIESIEILKDADATAIYGSRGANGVVLITTKKGEAGQTKFDLTLSSGFGRVARMMDVLDRREYLDMRYEALRNDGVTMETTTSAVYDLTSWDTTRSTDWQRELIGNTAQYTNAQLNMSGGNAYTNYTIGGNYWKETTVFPGDFVDVKGSARFGLTHSSDNNRFKVQLGGTFLKENNNLPADDLVNAATTLPPIAPPLYTDDGRLNFDGTNFWNPMASLYRSYDATGTNLNANGLLSYEIIKGLHIKANMGYSNFRFETLYMNPESGQNPANFAGPTSRISEFGDHTTETWNLEPQLSYNTQLLGHSLNVLLGSTFQRTLQEGVKTYTSGYVDDVLMKDRSLATASSATTGYSEYKYNAAFLRVNYNINDRYIANITARRDGSSRFGPGRQFGNFGAIGGAWIFSEEESIKGLMPFLTFGKLRASYGITGSDAVGNYGYMSLYSAASTTSLPYYGVNGNGLRPAGLANTEFQWETNRKADVALELGFLDNRILLNANYYHNRSSNQLVGYPISAVAGFTTAPLNLPATVQNTGWEIELNTTNINNKAFRWSTGFNVTIPRNKLIDYPLLESSSNANNYVIGEPLTIVKVNPTLGIDPETGIMVYENRFGEPVTNVSSLTALDRTKVVNISRDFYGGLLNTFNYKRFQLDVFLHFSKQNGLRYNLNGVSLPGEIANIPRHVYEGRWQYEGDDALYNRLSQSYSSDAYRGRLDNNADVAYADMYFIRLKNLSLSYQFNPEWSKRLGMQNFRVFSQGQNLFTLTNYLGMDPENSSASIAPIAVLNFGVQLTF